MKLNSSNKDLLSTLLNHLWRLISGPFTVLLIPIYLTATEQGYWFLFGSISALSILANLGFTNIILQFSAHEFAKLRFNSVGALEGEEIYLKKIGSLLRFVVKWTISICVLVFPFIYVAGVLFFNHDNVLSNYIIPWSIYSLGSCIIFFNNAVLSFIEGMNKIKTIQLIRLKVAIINTFVLILILISGGGIYALALGMFISASSILFFIYQKFKILIFQILDISKKFNYNWRNEVIPLFRKYAVSFLSSYFIFQIYVPVMQYFKGPVESGKVGITLVLVLAIFGASNIWIYTIIPKMNILVSKKSKLDLDLIFRKRLFYASLTYLLFSLALFVFVFIFKDFWIIPEIIPRFLSGKALLILLICYFFQLIINSLATYLRAHKEEPYMIPSLIVAIWVLLSTVLIAKYLPSEYFFLGFLSSYIWWVPISYFIYNRCKLKWYEK